LFGLVDKETAICTRDIGFAKKFVLQFAKLIFNIEVEGRYIRAKAFSLLGFIGSF
jgi:hypothetical protein